MAEPGGGGVGPEPGAGGPRPGAGRWVLFLGLAAGVLVLDQVTKAWVDASFALASSSAGSGDPRAPTPLVGDLVRISKTYNDGGIFGLLDAAAPWLALVSLLVIAGIAWYHWRHAAAGGPLLSATLGLVLGGALGNLVDRARFGHVVDFVDVGLGTLRWYAFNVADAAISLGLLLLIVLTLAGDRLRPRRAPVAPRAAGGPTTARGRS